MDPASLNPTTIVLPKETTLVSLCVNCVVPVDPVLLLISALTAGRSDLGTSFAYSNPGRRYGPGKNVSGTARTTVDPCHGSSTEAEASGCDWLKSTTRFG